MDRTVEYAVGALLPPLACALTAEDGTALDLTDATSVSLVMSDPRSGDELEQTATVTIAAAGTVASEVTADMTGTPREWLCRYTVTFASGRPVVVPSSGYLRMRVS